MKKRNVTPKTSTIVAVAALASTVITGIAAFTANQNNPEKRFSRGKRIYDEGAQTHIRVSRGYYPDENARGY